MDTAPSETRSSPRNHQPAVSGLVVRIEGVTVCCAFGDANIWQASVARCASGEDGTEERANQLWHSSDSGTRQRERHQYREDNHTQTDHTLTAEDIFQTAAACRLFHLEDREHPVVPCLYEVIREYCSDPAECEPPHPRDTEHGGEAEDKSTRFDRLFGVVRGRRRLFVGSTPIARIRRTGVGRSFTGRISTI
ncbi:hypothetical protein HFX_6093 (plasmid) [Haloferax mediterranei ATCC 33500]|uniref:Uncharacterized protein n=1 Tax=Haloferax mediterranei (strain ATCC 33500 / DSM 1411 / JCM 8866 / NBRC 14739 / NCIMB 2177 / R-4) TaxID=523841 RepID=I3RAF9_HALMT|nr:hypothetical protein HFX_6093 [Haloferax mediterranei ATCC 33500]